ncbi:MAG: DUF488 domain-containing protein [Ferroplasma sp.]|uniref:DUF488 domain-containing protein n=1 Tax=Ferroplasma sp. TaxID=2591003 RepID=UPI0028150922|nr:DUF488 domain-containing protein [Ferroplasma sp.]WMT51214.1 MAG: DUF488 domain-containing protein [Ferroplasma sp.]
MIRLKRVYDEYSIDDGIRILVERLWPRGISKEKAHIDIWMKEIAPSTELRKWFNHEDSKWEEFVQRYKNELVGNIELEDLRGIVSKNKNVTIIYSSRNKDHNNAVVLYGMLEPQ